MQELDHNHPWSAPMRFIAAPITTGFLVLGLVASFEGAASADRGLTEADVQEVMTSHGDDVRACYMQHGFKQRTATGKVVVSVVVQKNGATRDVKVDAPGVKGKSLSSCISGSARDWQFRPTGDVTEVQLPFLFQHTRARGAGPGGARRSSR
jgi:hypothetical protein